MLRLYCGRIFSMILIIIIINNYDNIVISYYCVINDYEENNYI